jgi:hypothetical protein
MEQIDLSIVFPTVCSMRYWLLDCFRRQDQIDSFSGTLTFEFENLVITKLVNYLKTFPTNTYDFLGAVIF